MNKSTGAQQIRATEAHEQRPIGHASLTEDEKIILSWNHEARLREFQKVNVDIDRRVLENKLLQLESLALDNGEILDALRTDPDLTWEMVMDMFLGGPADGYTSTLHGLEDINYPEHFWKAIVENEREKLNN